MSGLVERAPGIDTGRGRVGRRRLTLKQALLGMAGAIGLAAAATYGEHYWQVGRFEVETDDAYVRANSIIIAPRVAGYIAEVLVNDNPAGEDRAGPARIDDRDLRTALDQAIADREAAEHKVANLAAQLQLQQSLITEAEAQLASAEAAATFAAQDQKRYSDLAHTGAGSVQQAQQSQSLLLQRAADLQRAQAALAEQPASRWPCCGQRRPRRRRPAHAAAFEQQAG